MEYLVVSIFVWLLSEAFSSVKQINAQKASDAAREDTQDFNAQEAEKDREWQEYMYNQYYSPPAMLDQYKQIGASDAASVMAALGVSPTAGSGAMASSTPNSPISPLPINSLGTLFDQLTNGLLNESKTKGQDVSNQWQPTLNQASIDEIYGNLENMRERLKFDKDKFDAVERPMAESLIDKNESDIEEIKAKLNKIKEEVRLIQKQEALVGEQIETEKTVQDVNSAHAANELAGAYNSIQSGNRAGQEAYGQELENQMLEISKRVSDIVGFDVRIDPRNQVVYLGTELGRHAKSTLHDNQDKIGRSLKPQAHAAEMLLDEFFQLYDKNLDAASASLNRDKIENDAWDKVDGLLKNRTSKGWQKNHPDVIKNAKKRYKAMRR